MRQTTSLPDQAHLQCADEKIHIPGAIQPHGVLIAVTKPALLIAQVSKSVFTIFGTAHQDLIGQPIATLIGGEQQAELMRQVSAKTILENPLRLAVNCQTGKK